MYCATILRDSVAPCGERLTTAELTYPRIVHSEFMTHRRFSRNAASSRAIPTQRVIDTVAANPFFPLWWGKNQAGMEAPEELTGYALTRAREVWERSLSQQLDNAREFARLGLSKQVGNRILEPYSWIKVVVSATNWQNFFHQRCDAAAQPEIREIAERMAAAHATSEPRPLAAGDWHLPYVTDAEILAWPLEACREVAVARCAAVSHARDDVYGREQCERVFGRLLGGNVKHWSPFEHVAQAARHPGNWGNFVGFIQWRTTFVDEEVRTWTAPASLLEKYGAHS